MAINKNGQWIQSEFNERLLPDGYTQLEYIESTGTQYINTGLTVDTNTQWELKFRKTTSSVPYHGSFANNQRFRIDNNSAGLGTSYYLFNGNTSDILQDIDYLVFWNTKYITISLNGIIQTIGTNFTNSVLIYLFAMNSNNSSISYGKSRVYYSKFWQNDKLIRDFIPAKRNSDDTIGLYDRVNNIFYENAGTGTFTAGPQVGGITANAKIYKETNALEANEIWEI